MANGFKPNLKLVSVLTQEPETPEEPAFLHLKGLPNELIRKRAAIVARLKDQFSYWEQADYNCSYLNEIAVDARYEADEACEDAEAEKVLLDSVRGELAALDSIISKPPRPAPRPTRLGRRR